MLSLISNVSSVYSVVSNFSLFHRPAVLGTLLCPMAKNKQIKYLIAILRMLYCVICQKAATRGPKKVTISQILVDQRLT